MTGTLPPPPVARRDRSRGFVGGFNADDLEWEGWREGERFGTGLDRKLLSYDAGSGALTQLVRGERSPVRAGRAWTLAEDVLLLVLTGSAVLAGREIRRYGYRVLPAGWRGAGGLTSASGFEALWMGFGSESRSSGAASGGDLATAPWQSAAPGLPAPLPPGLLVKPIRRDANGGLVFLSGSLLRRIVDQRWEQHPAGEEQVYLAGEFTQMEALRSGQTRLHYTAGGYSFRPPGIWHLGPGSGTDSFCLRIVRTTETLVNSYRPAPGPYPDAYDW